MLVLNTVKINNTNSFVRCKILVKRRNTAKQDRQDLNSQPVSINFLSYKYCQCPCLYHFDSIGWSQIITSLMETNKPNHSKFAKSAAEVLAIINNYKKPSPDLENFLRMKSHVVILKQCYIMFKNFSEFFAQYQGNFALPCLSVKWKPLCLKKKIIVAFYNYL